MAVMAVMGCLGAVMGCYGLFWGCYGSAVGNSQPQKFCKKKNQKKITVSTFFQYFPRFFTFLQYFPRVFTGFSRFFHVFSHFCAREKKSKKCSKFHEAYWLSNPYQKCNNHNVQDIQFRSMALCEHPPSPSRPLMESKGLV